tara:strand:- start:190 stop:495 length:306 start_codon:yes stop_codon:yes gene_type:complete
VILSRIIPDHYLVLFVNNLFPQQEKRQGFKKNSEPLSPSRDLADNEMRYLELQRRLHVLQVRRNHLESELKAINNCLISLDSQLKTRNEYKQLLIQNTNFS